MGRRCFEWRRAFVEGEDCFFFFSFFFLKTTVYSFVICARSEVSRTALAKYDEFPGGEKKQKEKIDLTPTGLFCFCFLVLLEIYFLECYSEFIFLSVS